MKPSIRFITLTILGLALAAATAADNKGDLATQLREVDGKVIPAESDRAKLLPQMLYQDARLRLQAANLRETTAWREIKTKADWEKFRDSRLQALRASLGQFPPVPRDLKVRITNKIEGDGYRIENLVYESRPGLRVTANLYTPPSPPLDKGGKTASMPGILICHSHHNPKTQSELQDMGMMWARLGCLVLIMDQLGHGERRQHPFLNSNSYPGSFRPSRQDYHFRYNVGIQLHLLGDSLVGWMAWDMMRGVDLLLSRPGIDKERIILLGAVAGGGDPTGVTAALDPRIAAVAPFNFGGPQPETIFPLPADAESAFNYAGSGSWESTRNLRLSARAGFLPWVLVAVAPRRLIYAHEFAWDQERDPVWARLEKIYGFYDARDHLSSCKGRGSVKGKPPEATHCNNIGAVHRQQMYPALKRWFNIAIPEKENDKHLSAEQLACLTPDTPLKPLHELAAQIGGERSQAARARQQQLPAAARRGQLARDWARLLGDIEPKGDAKVSDHDKKALGNVTVERLVLEVERDIVVPLVLLVPPHAPEARLPIVVGFAQEGKQALLKNRAATIAELLRGGAAVCLSDLRGTGESKAAGDSRGRQSAGTSRSSTELMLGQTLLGSRLRDLRAVLRYLRSRPDLDKTRLALWGESLASPNPPDRNLAVPLDADKLPEQAEPLGGLLALFCPLFDDDIRAVSAHGGLSGYDALLHSYYCYVPHDVIVPGALTAGDLNDVAAVLAPRPLRLTGLVDGLNRRIAAEPLAQTFAAARTAYQAARAPFVLEGDEGNPAAWLLQQLK